MRAAQLCCPFLIRQMKKRRTALYCPPLPASGTKPYITKLRLGIIQLLQLFEVTVARNGSLLRTIE